MNTRQTFTAQVMTTPRILLTLILGLIFFKLQAQFYPPVAYWRFENPNPEEDVTGHGFHLNQDLTGLLTATTPPLAGDHFLSLPYSVLTAPQLPRPHLGLILDDSVTFNEVSLEFAFRVDEAFAQGGLINWRNKIQIHLSEHFIFIEYGLESVGYQTMRIQLIGTADTDPHYLLDRGWHHFAFTYTPSSGTIRVYIDGHNTPARTVHLGPSPRLVRGGLFFPLGATAIERFTGGLDEVAIYDTVLPPALVWQHYQELLAGNPYGTTLTFTGPIPPAPNDIQTGINHLEFGPNWPHVPLESWELLDAYPDARYTESDTMPRLFPWLSDITSTNASSRLAESGLSPLHPAKDTAIAYRLAKDYNYYLYVGDVIDYSKYDAFTNASHSVYFYARMLAGPATQGLPRNAITHWGIGGQPRWIDTTRSGNPYISRPFLPDTFYVRNALNVPTAGLRLNWEIGMQTSGARYDSLRHDGLAVRSHFKEMATALTSLGDTPFISMVGENDEIVFPLSDLALLQNDPECGPQLPNFPTLNAYESDRALRFRRIYRDAFRGYLDSLNALAGIDSLEVNWFNQGGDSGISSYQWSSGRNILRYNDQFHRGTPYIYPQTPFYWRTGRNNITGIQHLVKARRRELAFGDPIFMPSVSPGYADGTTSVEDINRLRPGQYLGLLKTIGMMGADTYTTFMYEGINQIYPGNWRIWHLHTPALAQAVSSRYLDLLYDSYLLPGDTAILSGANGRWETSLYSFKTGNSHDIVVARAHNTLPRYAISAATMRGANYESHGRIRKDISFDLREHGAAPIIDDMQVQARLQGSTYILDLSGPDTVFYQLDAWHEWTYPYYWCHDFTLEAELYDHQDSIPLGTERPTGAAPNDFRDFTTYTRIDSGISDTLVYNFRIKHPDQTDLYLWLRARTSAATTQSVDIFLDGSLHAILPIDSAQWQWIGTDMAGSPIGLTGLSIGTHRLQVVTSTFGLDLDKFLLIREPDSFPGQTFQPLAAALDSTVCFGDSLHFFTAGSIPVGCAEYHWDFGDSTYSADPNPAHLYTRVDTYHVELTVYHPFLDSTFTDLLTVIVAGPHVEAGPDTMICLGDTLTLQGEASYFFRWRQTSLVSSEIIQTPQAWPTQTGYMHLESWDPLSLCYNIDSVHISVLSLDNVYGVDKFPCDSSPIALEIVGGYHVWWEPDTLLSSDTIRNPVVTVDSATSFTAYVSDYCRCDTDTVVVWVFPNPNNLSHYAFPSEDTICHLDTVQLFAVGYNPNFQITWAPSSYLDNQHSANPTAVIPQYTTVHPGPFETYQYIVTGGVCGGSGSSFWVTDTLTVTVVQPPILYEWPEAGGWRDTMYICGTDSLQLSPTVHANSASAPTSWQWSPGHLFSDSLIQNPKVLVDTPTVITLNLGSALGCPRTYISLLYPSGIVGMADSIYQCPGDSVALNVDGYRPYAFTGMITAWQPSQYFSDPNSLHTTVSVPSTQTVTVTTGNIFCTVTDSIRIVVHGLPEFIGPDTARGCAGDTLPLWVEAANPVQWWRPPPMTPPGGLAVGDSTSPNTWTIFQGTPFTLYVASLDSFFCPWFDSVLVTWNDAILDDTLTMCYGDTLAIPTMPGGLTCTWIPATGLSNPASCDSPLTWTLSNTWYHLEHIDSLGCVSYDSIYIKVDSNCCHIPNTTLLDNALVSSLGSVSIFNGHYIVHDTLTIDTSINFSNSIFEMDPGAVVLVPPGIDLGTSYCTLRSSCDLKMWNTILLDSVTASFKSGSDHFEDAEVAVTAQDGGFYNISNATLTRNHRGTLMLPWATGNTSHIDRSQFSKGGQMLPPYDLEYTSWAGIEINGIPNAAPGSDNTFDSLHYGIRVINSNAIIQGNHFNYMLPTPLVGQVAGAGIYITQASWGTVQVGQLPSIGGIGQNTFTLSRYGVYQSGEGDLKVYGNSFSRLSEMAIAAVGQIKDSFLVAYDTIANCRIGIYSGLGRDIDAHVRRNLITGNSNSVRTGIFVDGATFPGPDHFPFLVEDNDISLYGHGLRARAGDHVTFLENTVAMTPGSDTCHAVKLEGMTLSEIRENILSSDYSNLTASRTNMRGIYVESSPQTTVHCNEVQNFGWAITFRSLCNASSLRQNRLLNAVDGLVLTASGEIGTQGSPSDPTDNIWYGSYTNGETHSINSLGNLSKIFARLTTSPWAVTMPTVNLASGFPSIPVDFDTVASASPIDTTQCTENENGGGGIDELGRAIQNNPEDYNVWNEQNDWKAKAWAYEVLEKDSSLTLSNNTLAAFKSYADTAAMGNLVKAGVEIKEPEWATANGLLDQTVPISILEALTKKVRQERIAFELVQPADTAALRMAAQMCPDEGGPAVFEARMILLALGNEWIDSAD